jgi:hypothetical protein
MNVVQKLIDTVNEEAFHEALFRPPLINNFFFTVVNVYRSRQLLLVVNSAFEDDLVESLATVNKGVSTCEML